MHSTEPNDSGLSWRLLNWKSAISDFCGLKLLKARICAWEMHAGEVGRVVHYRRHDRLKSACKTSAGNPVFSLKS
jgi:hypothetical protein